MAVPEKRKLVNNMTNVTLFGFDIHAAVYIPVLYFLWVSVFLILKVVLFGKIRSLADRTTTKLDDIFLDAANLPLVLLIFVSGVFVLDNIFKFGTDSELLQFIDIAFKSTAIIAIIMFCDKFLRGLIETYAQKVPALRDSKGVVHIVVRAVVSALILLL